MTLSLQNLAILRRKGEGLLHNFNLSIQNGEIVTLMGPSGCGKSTLLSVISGHLAPDFHYSGQVILDNKRIDNLAPHQRQVGMLFQDDLLFPHLCIWENLAFALPNHIKGTKRRELAMNALKKISLSTLANVFPDQISGGQRARISLTRMLLAQPKLALLDEPFSKLDKTLRAQFREWVFTQLTNAGIPTLMVTHDEEDAPVGSQICHWPMKVKHA